MSAHCVSPTALPNEKGGRSLSSSCLFQLDECYRADSVVTLLPWIPPYASCACANDILSSPRPIRAATVSAKKRLMFSLLRGVGLTHWELKRRSQRGVVRNHTLRSVRAETCPPAPAHSSPCCPDCVFGSHDGSALCPANRSCTGLAGSCVIAIALRRSRHAVRRSPIEYMSPSRVTSHSSCGARPSTFAPCWFCTLRCCR